MRRTDSRLADGRELFYYDDEPAPGAPAPPARELHDTRELPTLSTASEVRYDVLLDEWVAVASHRQGRTHLPPTDQCPLCPSTPERATEVPAHDYDVAVFENRFPSFALGVPDPPPLPGGTPPTSERRAGRSRCEVVCFTSDHSSAFPRLAPDRVRTVVDAWADRTEALNALPDIEQVFVFENRGVEIGVTLSHPHGQIYGYPFVTPRTRRQLEQARRHRERYWSNLFADVLAAEQAAGERVVTSGEHWTAFVPVAARWPFEVHLYPHRQVPDLPALTTEERADLAEVYLDVLRRLDGLFDAPAPYIAAWHQAPANIDRELSYLHLELFSVRREAGKLKYLAGSESGMGVFINDVPPERAAHLLRESTGKGPTS